MSNHIISNDAAWSQRYETLRQNFLGASSRLQSTPLGLLLFIREGLAGWMRAWNQEPPPSVPSVQSFNRPDSILPSTCGWQRELTFLLAQMTTLHLQLTSLR